MRQYEARSSPRSTASTARTRTSTSSSTPTSSASSRRRSRRPPQVLHGVRDPPHVEARGLLARGGAARAARTRASTRCPAAAPRSSPTACARIAPGKEPADDWFDIHGDAHHMGIPTNCTMLYGHIETAEERVDHLLRLREQQDKTGGFLAFIPLAFHPENTEMARLASHDRLRRPEDDRDRAPHARQHPAHQGVLDHAGPARSRSRAALRRRRRPGHRRRASRSSRPPARRPAPSRRSSELVRFVRDAGRFRFSATRITTRLRGGPPVMLRSDASRTRTWRRSSTASTPEVRGSSRRPDGSEPNADRRRA